MGTIDFLRSVVGSSGYYCVWAIRDGKRVQKFYKTLEAVEHAALNLDAEGYDAYFALGTFSSGTSREVAEVQEMRSFFVDLDCGLHVKTKKMKDYPDQAAAMAALREFCKTNGLPKPTLVNSGYGLHAYWPLEEPVSYDRWLPVATRLKALAARQGFKIDTTRTADAASILRVPGTHNYKDPDDAADVSLLGLAPKALPIDEFDALLGDDEEPDHESEWQLGAVSQGDDPLLSTLAGRKEFHFPRIISQCPQMKFIVEHRATLPEPLWQAGLSVARACVDSEAAAMEISQDYPTFDREETLQKMSRSGSPRHCETFDELNPGVCQSCPFWANRPFKSPIALGGMLRESDNPEEHIEVMTPSGLKKVYDIPAYPKPYFRMAGGGVALKYWSKEEEADVTMQVCQYDLYVVNRLTDPESGENIVMRLHLPHDGVREFTVPLATVTSKEEFRKVLSANGVAAINKEVDLLMTYTQTWISELQKSVQADEARRQFGWTDDTYTAFALGDQLITKDGIEYNAPSSSTRGMFKGFAQKGTLDEWKTAMDFYNRPGFELHQLIVCAGLGSILMPFTEIGACIINLFSKDSGFGKTTAQYAALSHWGVPKVLVMSENDTHNSRMNRMEVMKNLPICIDEITNIKPLDASDMIYNVSGSRQRNRLASNGNVERHRGDPWSLIVITSSNCSIIDKVSTAKAMPRAEAQRMLEIEVSRRFAASAGKAETDAFTSLLHQHHGHSGIVFVQYVIERLPAVRKLVAEVQRSIDEAADLGPENRFWSAGVACAIATLIIARKIGLLGYDVKTLTQFAVTEVLDLNKHKAVGLNMAAKDLVAEYVYSNWGKILQIKSTVDRRGRQKADALQTALVPPEVAPRVDIVGRYEPDTRRLFLIPKPFREWLVKQQLDYNSVRTELENKLNATQMMIRISKGLPMNLPPVNVLTMTIDIDAPDDADAAE